MAPMSSVPVSVWSQVWPVTKTPGFSFAVLVSTFNSVVLPILFMTLLARFREASIEDAGFYITFLTLIRYGIEKTADTYSHSLIVSCSNSLTRSLQSTTWRAYDRLTHKSKSHLTAKSFNDKQSKYIRSVGMIAKNTPDFIFEFLSSAVNILCTVYQENRPIVLLGVIITYLVMEHFYFREATRKLGDIEKKLYGDFSAIDQKKSWLIPSYQRGERTLDSIIDISLAEHQLNIEHESKIIHYNFIRGSWLTFLIGTIVWNSSSYAEFMQAMYAATTLRLFFHYYDWFSISLMTDRTNIISYLEEMNKHKLDIEADQLPFTGFTTSVVKTRRGTDGPNFSVMPCSRTLVTGPSGAGKTTLVDGLRGTGPDGNIRFTGKVQPENLRQAFVTLPQGSLPDTTYASLREIFFNAPSETINCFLKLVWGDDAERIMDAIDLETSDEVHLHDKPIRNLLSGGQLSRLMLAMTAYIATLPENQGKVLFLDEPLSNVETQLYNSLMQELLEFVSKHNPSAAILIIAHPCPCKMAPYKNFETHIVFDENGDYSVLSNAV